MKKQLLIAFRLFLVLTILTGIIYPLSVTFLSQRCFPAKANGSLVMKNGRISGSELIGQQFSGSGYFWPRPSATGYNTLPSSGSNLGPTSVQLRGLEEKRRSEFISRNMLNSNTQVPVEMLFASGSGLDPHISLQAAILQINRVAEARGFDSAKKLKLQSLVFKFSEKPQYSFFGEERVNVFMLNLELDNLK